MRLYTVLNSEDVEILRKVAEPVMRFDQDLVSLSEDMLSCMRANGGIGLAAPQVGLSLRMVVVQLPQQEPLVLVNPTFEALPREPYHQSVEEGCLSIPGFAAQVQRFSGIQVSAYDARGQAFSFEADELLSICVQHECDHLDGVLFVDRLSRRQQRRFWQEVEKRRAEEAEG